MKQQATEYSLFSKEVVDSIDSIAVPEGVLWLIFFVVLLISVSVGSILHYHWIKYGRGNATIIMSQTIYTLVTLIALIVVMGSITYYR